LVLAAAGIGVAGLARSSASAGVVAGWDFTDNNWTVDVDNATGTPTLTHNFAGDGTVTGGAARFTSKANNGKIATLAVNTTAFSDLSFAFDSWVNDLGSFTTLTLAYSTNDGTSWNNLSPTFTEATSSATGQYDLSALAGVNNNANFQLRFTFSGAGNGASKYAYLDNIQLRSGNDSQITSAGSVNFGRVLVGSTASQNVSLSKTGIVQTTYTATRSNDGISVTADGAIGSLAQTESIAITLANTANGTATTGSKTFTVTVDNTASTSNAAGQGSADANDIINVYGTVVAKRTVTADTIALGNWLKGATYNGTATLRTTGTDDHFTRVSVAGNTFDADGESYSHATNTAVSNVINASSGTLASFAVTGEGLAGEGSYGPVAVGYTATVYNPALAESQFINQMLKLKNKASGPAADLQVESIVADAGNTQGWTVASSLPTIAAGLAAQIAQFNDTGLLNGLNYSGTFRVTARNAATIGGQPLGGTASADVLNNADYIVSGTVGGKIGDGDAHLTGGTYAGLSATSDHTEGTVATLLDGDVGGTRTLSVAFSEGPSDIISDEVDVNGTTTDLYVLQLSYSDVGMTLEREQNLMLGWFDDAQNQWINAVTGNSDGGAGAPSSPIPSGYNSAYKQLSKYGVDTDANVVWAVLDHNSSFGVMAIPEPATGLAAVGLLAFGALRRRRR
jgi:uncharacterized protein (TIGR03382 family)